MEIPETRYAETSDGVTSHTRFWVKERATSSS
jgi:hypothetical protein